MITLNQVYDYIESAVNTVERPVFCSSVLEPIPDTFPACQILSLNHLDYQRTLPLSFAGHESVSRRMDFEAHVFSNKKNLALSEAREIMDDVEIAFRQLWFVETSCMQSDNVDPSIIHMVARFTRNVGDGDELT